MLIIVLVAFFATGAFYRQAKSVGVHPGKAASIPFFFAGLFLILAFLLSKGIEQIADWTTVSLTTIILTSIMANLFLFTAYLLLIKKSWRTLFPQAPIKNPSKSVPSE